MKYATISKDIFSSLYQSYKGLDNSPLDQTIIKLVELRVSQINGCAYCCSMHSNEARKAGISQEKIDVLMAWHLSKLFTEQERAALQWCEDLTIIDTSVKKGKPNPPTNDFSERELVDLTACIALMNAYNRVAMGIGDD